MAHPKTKISTKQLFVATAALVAGLLPLSGAWALHEQQEQLIDGSQDAALSEAMKNRVDPSAAMMKRDAVRARVESYHYDEDDDEEDELEGLLSRLKVISRGRRLEPDATTDVWTLGRFAYTGTFNDPCGGTAENAGVHVWRVRNNKDSKLATVIPSPIGSRSNDVKAARMRSGRVLVHSNESCAGGPGGFEIYDVNNPKTPNNLASVRIDELNPISDALFGGITDVGVHNLWLFRQGRKDYVAAVAETAFDNFQIYDITDPTSPTLVSAWGAEEIFDPGVGDLTDLGDPNQVSRVLNAALWLLDGFGSSTNRFLHDITISADGTKAYLSNWDAGLVLLDISDPADPQLVSVALDPVNGSLDGEVNSHAAWPSEDGSIVVETEEDFNAWEGTAPPGNLTFQDVPTNVIPGTAIATVSGDAFEASGNQTTNSGSVDGPNVTVTGGPLAGQTFFAIELDGSQPRFEDTGPVSGNFVWIGRACTGDPLVNPLSTGDIAIVRRGACFFSDKLNIAATNGAAAIIISNNVTTSTPWSGVRIWDYSDPANPVLASTFDTFCSASLEPSAECNVLGTYSVHNVIVETKGEEDDDKDNDKDKDKDKDKDNDKDNDKDEGRRVKAYISWYWDGVLILDVTDPYDPVEIARFSRTDPEFEAQNGGHQDFWGIYKERNRSRIFASDRNGGLYVFKEKKLDDDDDDALHIAVRDDN